MADNIRATPRNEFLGLLSDAMSGGLNWMRDPQRTQQMQGLAGLLESTGIPKTTERMAYGEPLTNIGRANVPLLKPETADAMMTVAPFAPKGMKMIRATEGMPVGMSIKDVGKSKINVQLNEGSNFLSAKSKFGQVGGTIRQPDRLSDVPYLQINYAEVEKASRGKGKGKELYQALIDEAKARGLRVFSDSTVEKPAVNVYKSLEKGGYKLKDMTSGSLEDGTVYGSGAAKPAFEILSTKSIQAPQQAALDLAQQRAALPVEQGGLGLPANNTAEMRAEALGTKTDAYHGSKQDITGLFKAGYDDNLAFVTQSPEFASKWIGKGKLNQRIGAEDEIKAAEDLYREIKYRNTDNELLSKLQGEEFNTAYDKMSANARAEQQKEFGLRGNASGIHDTVYPVKVQANKTFNPETDMEVMSDFFKQNDIPQKLQELYASGNYMMYETKPVVEYLKSKGYDSMRLRESTGDNYPTIAVFNPETVRSRFAAFDPFRKDVATATAMGVALPDLLAAELPEEELKRNQSAGLLFP